MPWPGVQRRIRRQYVIGSCIDNLNRVVTLFTRFQFASTALTVTLYPVPHVEKWRLSQSCQCLPGAAVHPEPATAILRKRPRLPLSKCRARRLASVGQIGGRYRSAPASLSVTLKPPLSGQVGVRRPNPHAVRRGNSHWDPKLWEQCPVRIDSMTVTEKEVPAVWGSWARRSCRASPRSSGFARGARICSFVNPAELSGIGRTCLLAIPMWLCPKRSLSHCRLS